MQFMFVLAALFLTFSLILSAYPREEPSLDKESQAVVLNMAAWHKAAIRVCSASPCPDGVVNPTSQLSSMLTSNSARLQATFETMYDGASKNIVTFIRPGALSKFDGPTTQTINGQVRDAVGYQTDSLGIFNSSTRKIVPSYANRLGYEKLVPASISGSITDGSLVIMTRM